MKIIVNGQEIEVGNFSGTDGKSAYEYAVEGGYTGTEDDFKALMGTGPWLSTSGGTLTGRLNVPSYGGLRLYDENSNNGELVLKYMSDAEGTNPSLILDQYINGVDTKRKICISWVAWPQGDNDAATKEYVDYTITDRIDSLLNTNNLFTGVTTFEDEVRLSNLVLTDNNDEPIGLLDSSDNNINLVSANGEDIMIGYANNLMLHSYSKTTVNTNELELEILGINFRAQYDSGDLAIIYSGTDTIDFRSSLNKMHLRGIANPVASSDAATKDYVDNYREKIVMQTSFSTTQISFSNVNLEAETFYAINLRLGNDYFGATTIYMLEYSNSLQYIGTFTLQKAQSLNNRETITIGYEKNSIFFYSSTNLSAEQYAYLTIQKL